MINKLSASVLILAFVLLLALYVLRAPDTARANVYTATSIGTATTSAATSVTTSTRIMATSTNPLDPTNSHVRVYAVVCNPNANPVALNLNGDKAANLTTGQVTAVIAAAAGYNACFEITDRNLYSGSVTASSTNQTATTITVQQFVQ